MRKTTILSLLLFARGSLGFVPPSKPQFANVSPEKTSSCSPSTTALSSDKGKNTKSGLDGKVRTRLLTETIAPWRSVRLFFYGALGGGALLGGIITLSGALAALSGARSDLDMNTEYTNLAIDFGAVAVFAILAKFDWDKQIELDARVEEKIVQTRAKKKVVRGMKEREAQLGTLKLDVQISGDGATREAAVRELQAGARQHMIIVAGPKKACRDALVGANLLKMDFALSNVLVVPYETDVDGAELLSRPSGGFGDRPMYETQPYVARPAGEGWEDYIQAEMQVAVEQSGEKAKEEGIAIVVARNGEVVRRGVGKVPWRQMVEQLEESADSKSSSFFS